LKVVRNQSSIVENNLSNAEKSSEVAEKIQIKSRETQMSFNDLRTCMGEITKSNERLDRLFAAINEIGEKTKLIDDIVLKTQLLSFNASIEAERAGEHGRGFAVVAEEVGLLAKVSGESAQAISLIVKNAVIEAKEVIDGSKKLAYEGENHCEESSIKMNEVVVFSEKILKLSHDIVNACKEQSVGIKQITASLDTLNTNTQENLSVVEKSNVATTALSQQAVQMKLTVQEIEMSSL
jgi:methyl-accepting chemotaxis protein